MEIILVLVVVMISSMAAIAKVRLVVVHLSHAGWEMLLLQIPRDSCQEFVDMSKHKNIHKKRYLVDRYI